MKISGTRRALALSNVFNLLVGIYFIVISIISLVQLRWYHQLTITTRVRHIVTSTTSYFAFIILIVVALVLIAIFVISSSNLSTKIYISSFENQDEATTTSAAIPIFNRQQYKRTSDGRDEGRRFVENGNEQSTTFKNKTNDNDHQIPNSTTNFCSLLLHLIAAVGFVVIIVIWLLNTGELVRDSISTQLDLAYSRYQFANRSNHYSVAIDAMQDINNCCGSLDYTDFPQRRSSGLGGHYPGSCCGKNIFGVNARVICLPEEVVRAKQTVGCVMVVANYYDLVSLLVVPVALVGLFVSVMVIAMTTLLRGRNEEPQTGNIQATVPSTSAANVTQVHQEQSVDGSRFIQAPDKLDLGISTTTTTTVIPTTTTTSTLVTTTAT